MSSLYNRISDMEDVSFVVTGDEIIPIFDPQENNIQLRNKVISIDDLRGFTTLVWYLGITEPDTDLGTNQDHFLNYETGDVYEKTDLTTWTLIGNINIVEEGTISSVNNILADEYNNISIGYSDFGDIVTAITNIRDYLNDFKTQLLTSEGSGLIGLACSETYTGTTLGAELAPAYCEPEIQLIPYKYYNHFFQIDGYFPTNTNARRVISNVGIYINCEEFNADVINWGSNADINCRKLNVSKAIYNNAGRFYGPMEINVPYLILGSSGEFMEDVKITANIIQFGGSWVINGDIYAQKMFMTSGGLDIGLTSGGVNEGILQVNDIIFKSGVIRINDHNINIGNIFSGGGFEFNNCDGTINQVNSFYFLYITNIASLGMVLGDIQVGSLMCHSGTITVGNIEALSGPGVFAGVDINMDPVGSLTGTFGDINSAALVTLYGNIVTGDIDSNGNVELHGNVQSGIINIRNQLAPVSLYDDCIAIDVYAPGGVLANNAQVNNFIGGDKPGFTLVVSDSAKVSNVVQFVGSLTWTSTSTDSPTRIQGVGGYLDPQVNDIVNYSGAFATTINLVMGDITVTSNVDTVTIKDGGTLTIDNGAHVENIDLGNGELIILNGTVGSGICIAAYSDAAKTTPITPAGVTIDTGHILGPDVVKINIPPAKPIGNVIYEPYLNDYNFYVPEKDMFINSETQCMWTYDEYDPVNTEYNGKNKVWVGDPTIPPPYNVSMPTGPIDVTAGEAVFIMFSFSGNDIGWGDWYDNGSCAFFIETYDITAVGGDTTGPTVDYVKQVSEVIEVDGINNPNPTADITIPTYSGITESKSFGVRFVGPYYGHIVLTAPLEVIVNINPA